MPMTNSFSKRITDETRKLEPRPARLVCHVERHQAVVCDQADSCEQ